VISALRVGLRVGLRVARRIADALAALLLLAILGVAVARVIGRYLLGAGLPWSEELTRLLFIWLIFVGAARASHMRIDLLPAALAPRARRALEIGSALLCVLLLAILAWYGIGMVQLTAGDHFTALGLSVQYLYWAAVLGAALWIVLLLADTFLGEAEHEPPVA
jgi:TRAP-type C4-dicarboxylate transport system permease small subunit